MQLAIEKALAHDIGAVSVFNSHHFGACGYYALMATRKDLIGIVSSSSRIVTVVPTHGAERVLGTNPLCFAAPAGRQPPVVLDMSTSVVAANKVKVYALNGKPIPSGWVIGRRRAATDGFGGRLPAPVRGERGRACADRRGRQGDGRPQGLRPRHRRADPGEHALRRLLLADPQPHAEALRPRQYRALLHGPEPGRVPPARRFSERPRRCRRDAAGDAAGPGGRAGADPRRPGMGGARGADHRGNPHARDAEGQDSRDRQGSRSPVPARRGSNSATELPGRASVSSIDSSVSPVGRYSRPVIPA